MNNVLGYVRVSGRGQLDGDGPERQEEAITSFCAKHSLNLVPRSDSKIFFSESISGTIDGFERPVFEEMAQAIEASRQTDFPIAGFVVENANRLARKLTVSEILLAECRSRGISVFLADAGGVVDFAADEGDPMRVLLRQMLACISEYQKSELVKKLRVARERKRAENGHCEGRKPFGERPIERSILDFALRTYELVPDYTNVARMLNDGGMHPRHGAKFTRQSVRHLILNYKKKLCEPDITIT